MKWNGDWKIERVLLKDLLITSMTHTFTPLQLGKGYTIGTTCDPTVQCILKEQIKYFSLCWLLKFEVKLARNLEDGKGNL